MQTVLNVYRCVDWLNFEARFASGKIDIWGTNQRISNAIDTRLYAISHGLEDIMADEIRDVNWKTIEVELGFRKTMNITKKKADGTPYDVKVAGGWSDFDPTSAADQKRYQKAMNEYLQEAAEQRYKELPTLTNQATGGTSVDPAFASEAASVLKGVFKTLKDAGFSLPTVSDIATAYLMSGKAKAVKEPAELRKQLLAYFKQEDTPYELVDTDGKPHTSKRMGPNPSVAKL